jgi:AAA15 family ATPase/GTPase
MSGTPNHMISEIKLPEEMSNSYTVFDQKSEDGQKETIPNLSKVNLFIGANNSGKSRFLRGVFGEKLLKFLIHDIDINMLINQLNNLQNEIKDEFSLRRVKEITIDRSNPNNPFVTFSDGQNGKGARLLQSMINLSKIVEFDSDLWFFKAITYLYSNVNEENKSYLSPHPIKYNTSVDDNLIYETIEGLFQKYLINLMDLYAMESDFLRRIYVPTLRGLRPQKELLLDGTGQYQKYRCDDFHQNRTLFDYFRKNDKIDEYGSVNLVLDMNKQEIFTGLTMFEKIFEHLLGDEVERDLIKEYENFLSEEFFEDKGISLLPKKGSDVLSVKLGNEEFPIYELGDGIQQLIIMTFPVFLHQNNNILLFIEEPELYLHPGMQRQLIEILLNHPRFKNVQTFVTTHSNHLLDLTLDLDNISVYRFEKDNKKSEEDPKNPQFKIHPTHNEDVQLLQSLGVRTSSVFLSNCTIWVEGISDRIYLRKYLKIYQAERSKNAKKDEVDFKIYKEDYHFSFIEYGGNNITHWSFLDSNEGIDFKSISKNIFLIADQDDGKEMRHEKLKKELGDNFYCLKCREIENLLSKRILINTVKSYLSDQLEVNEAFEEKAYKLEKIGGFIQNQVLKDIQNVKGSSFSTETGRFTKDKAVFARKAVGLISEYSELSGEAKELCELIYNFIENANSD